MFQLLKRVHSGRDRNYLTRLFAIDVQDNIQLFHSDQIETSLQ